jgi:hypothetical protein
MGRKVAGNREETSVALARVVTFEEVGADRIAAMKQSIEEGEQPDDLPASEVVILHDADAQSALAIVFFENEDDYRRGDATLSAMSTGDVPGRRASVQKYDVAVRATR